ncbi:hypothetical protein ACIO93_00155 [Streptomyces sp. NPDC087903]
MANDSRADPARRGSDRYALLSRKRVPAGALDRAATVRIARTPLVQ